MRARPASVVVLTWVTGFWLRSAPAQAQEEPASVVRNVRFEVVDVDGAPTLRKLGRAFAGRGNDALRTAMVQQESDLRAHIWPMRWSGDRVSLDPSVLAEDALRLELWYAHHGYFDAEVLGWEVQTLRPAARVPWMHRADYRGEVVRLTGYVREGEPSVIRSVTIAGLERAGRPIQLKVQRSVDDVIGDVFDLDTPYALTGLIDDLMQQQSYARVHTELSVSAYPEERAVDITIQVTPGPACTFGDVQLVGLDQVPPELLQSHLRVVPGEAFSPRALQDTQTALFNLGTFSVVQMLREEGPDPSVIPYTVQVSESPFRRFRVGPGLSVQTSEAQVRATTSFKHTNLGGRLIHLETSASVGLKAFSTAGNTSVGAVLPLLVERAQGDTGADLGETASTRFEGGPFVVVEADLAWPRFLGLENVSLTPQATYAYDLEVGLYYQQLELGPGFTWRVTPHLSLSPSYSFALWRTQLQFQDPDRPQVSEADQNYLLNVLSVSALLDHRDHPIYTRRGYYAQLTLSDAGRWVLPGRSFSSVDLDLRRFASVQWPVRAVAAGRVVAGVVRPYGDPPDNAVPYNELYFVGGPDTVRGWAQGYFGPRSCFSAAPDGPEELVPVNCYTLARSDTTVQVYPAGAEAVLYGSLEYRITGPFSIDYAAFVDVGSFNADLDGEGSFLTQIHPSVGGGIRYRTPVGPLRVDVGYRLRKPQGQFVLDRRWGLHISLTEAF